MKPYKNVKLTVCYVSSEDLISTSLSLFDAEGNNEVVFDGKNKFVPGN